MRIAVVSDIHGNRTAFEAVLADLRHTSPDLILHGGDLAHGGSDPVEVVDRIRDLGWPGVAGNVDEMLWRPQALTEFAARSAGIRPLLPAISEMAEAARNALGEERLDWLRGLPIQWNQGPAALVHASPGDCWRSPGANAADVELETVYAPLRAALIVYGHIHTPFVRRVSGMTIVNAGSVGLPYDGDPRASYLLLDDDSGPAIRRVEYDRDREIAALHANRVPHAAWIARMLKTARPQAI